MRIPGATQYRDIFSRNEGGDTNHCYLMADDTREVESLNLAIQKSRSRVINMLSSTTHDMVLKSICLAHFIYLWGGYNQLHTVLPR